MYLVSMTCRRCANAGKPGTSQTVSQLMSSHSQDVNSGCWATQKRSFQPDVLEVGRASWRPGLDRPVRGIHLVEREGHL